MLAENRKQEVIALCQSLVRLKSYSGEENLVSEQIQSYAKEKGFDEVIVDDFGNVLLVMTGDQQGPTVLFDGHIDTVPVQTDKWNVDPFSAEIKDGKIFGRGTSDMKGAVSAMILAAVYFADDSKKSFPGKIVISCSVHEECFEGVATRKVSARMNPDYVVIGEATNLNLNRGQRGRAEISLETFGKTAHSSNPDKGINAVNQMMKLMSEIQKLPVSEHEVLGKGILELTDIKSFPYPGASVVPSNCVVTLDRRLLVNETRDSVLSPILSVIKQLESEDEKFKAEAKFSEGEEKCYTGSVIEAERFFPGWVYDEKEKFVDEVYQQLLAINPLTQLSHYSFCTNGSHFAGELNIPTIGYGPSAENLAHIDNEYIEIEQLTRVTEGYIAIMRTLTSQSIIKKEDKSYV